MEEIKQGYKQTDIGVIPEDWEVSPIKQIFDICNNQRLPISEEVRKKMQGIFPYYGPTKIQDYINEYRLEGEYALIGEDGDHFLKWKEMAMTQLTSGKFNVNNHAHILKGKNNITTTKWFYYFFKNRDITGFLARQGAGRYKLSKATLSEILCAYPTQITEQATIANALSDTDALIAALDKKIAKKQQIKQGAMQQLLNGKNRLPGFSGEWVEKKLYQVALNIKTGKRNGEDNDLNGKYPFFVRSKNVLRLNSYSFDGEAILIPGEGGIGTIFHYINGKFDYHQRVYKISNFIDESDGRFIFYYLKYFFGSYALQNSVKATVDSLRLATFEEFLMTIPNTKTEQTAIAQILTDMDNEIARLEKERDKYKDLKAGMMQVLLTGKVRLV